jgi:3-oxoadipate enol-lactonase/4-carboxymuconolactone decarboxylase
MFTDITGLTVHVQQEGPPGGPVLLLLHSLATNLHVWDAQAGALSGGFRIVRLDLRGHGLTGVTAGPYSIDGLADDVLAVMDALGHRRFCVAGLSIGGLIAQSMARRAPDRVASLVLCDTALAIPPASMWRERAATVRAHGTAAVADAVLARWMTAANADSAAARGLRAMLLATRREGYAAACEAIAALAPDQATTPITAPTLVLVGDQDAATTPADAEALAAAIPGAQLHVIADAAHIAPVERPEAVTAAMAAFLVRPAGDLLQQGFVTRREVLGDAHVDRAVAATTEFDREFQAHITRSAWGAIWSRPQLDRRTRSLLTLAVLAALGQEEELKLHLRATANTGATPQDVAEMFLHISIYAGVPVANTGIRFAKEILAQPPGGA